MPAARAEVACLMYHEVTDNPTTSGFQRTSALQYAHSPVAFRAHLERIAARALRPVLIADLDLTRPGRHLLLTFDDGGRSARYAAGLLEDRGWRGHFFVVTSKIGDRTFLSAQDIRALHGAGHLIGSHSHTHPDIFRNQSRARMLDEWHTSAAILEDLLGEPCLAASVPGGDLSSDVLATASEARFRYLFTSEPWFTPKQLHDCWIIGRVILKTGTLPRDIEAFAQLRGWRQAQLVRGLKAVVKRGLGPLYRIYVERTTSPTPATAIRASAGRSAPVIVPPNADAPGHEAAEGVVRGGTPRR